MEGNQSRIGCHLSIGLGDPEAGRLLESGGDKQERSPGKWRLHPLIQWLISQASSPVRYAKFESIRYFIDNDILKNCLIDIDIFQYHHIDIDIFGIALSILISISIFSTSPYQYRYRYFSKVSIYRQSICHIDISNRATPEALLGIKI